jgi:hypothetical protein
MSGLIMLPKTLTMIGRKYDQRLLPHPETVEFSEYRAQPAISIFDLSVISAIDISEALNLSPPVPIWRVAGNKRSVRYLGFWKFQSGYGGGVIGSMGVKIVKP